MKADLGTWGFYLSIVALLLMYPVGVLINMTTPLIQNWIATSTKASLDRRILKLETMLAKLEKSPPIDDVQNELLWGIRSIKIALLAATGTIVTVVYAAVHSLMSPDSQQFKEFATLAVLILVANFMQMLFLRYRRDLRHMRSPRVRENLSKAIAGLKEIQSNWGKS